MLTTKKLIKKQTKGAFIIKVSVVTAEVEKDGDTPTKFGLEES